MIKGKVEFTLVTIAELVLGYLSPTMIIILQCIVYFNNTNLDQPYWFFYWELVAWTAFFLWLRFGLMLRSVKAFSLPIRMIQESFVQMGAFLLLVMFGVFAFTNSFLAIRQVLYITTAGSEEPVEPPFDKTAEVHDL